MPVKLTCNGCKTSLRVRDELAGKKVKCPRCSAVLIVPLGADEEEDTGAAETMREERISPSPRPPSRSPGPKSSGPKSSGPKSSGPKSSGPKSAGPKSSPIKKPARHDEDDEEPPSRGKAGIRAGRPTARDEDSGRLRSKGRERDEEDEDVADGPRFKPCPRCGASGATRVKWTPWGSFYGPAMLTHVRCPECAYCYNGKSGRSNLVGAVAFVSVTLLGLLGIIGGLFLMLWQRGYF